MFPPQETEIVETWVEGLWASLQRAGGHFTNEASIERLNEEVIVTLRLKDQLPTNAKLSVMNYIKEYSRQCGWKVEYVRHKKDYVMLCACKARSSFSIKPKAIPSGSKTLPKP